MSSRIYFLFLEYKILVFWKIMFFFIVRFLLEVLGSFIWGRNMKSMNMSIYFGV